MVTAIAPIRAQANQRNSISGELSRWTSTRSPSLMPRAWSPAATRRTALAELRVGPGAAGALERLPREEGLAAMGLGPAVHEPGDVPSREGMDPLARVSDAHARLLLRGRFPGPLARHPTPSGRPGQAFRDAEPAARRPPAEAPRRGRAPGSRSARGARRPVRRWRPPPGGGRARKRRGPDLRHGRNGRRGAPKGEEAASAGRGRGRSCGRPSARPCGDRLPPAASAHLRDVSPRPEGRALAPLRDVHNPAPRRGLPALPPPLRPSMLRPRCDPAQGIEVDPETEEPNP